MRKIDRKARLLGETFLSDEAASGPAPRQRWYQFTLRAVLVLTFLAGVLLTGWRIFVAPYRRQVETIELVKQLGGTYQAEPAPSCMNWMSWLAGGDVQNVTLVDMAECDKPEDYIRPVALCRCWRGSPWVAKT